MGTKHPVLQGFYIQPLVHIVDLDDETIESYQGAQQMFIPAGELRPFVDERWVQQWDAIKEQIHAQAREQVAAATAEKKRATRAAKRTTAPTRRTTRVVDED